MNKDLTIGAPSKVLAGFCLPMFASVIFQQLYNIADSLVAGKLIGSAALASVGNSYEITLLYLAFAVGCNTGCSVMTAQLFGGKRYKELRTCISTVLIFVVFLCAVLMTAGLCGGEGLLRLIKTPPELMNDSFAYLKIYTFGLPFLFLYNVSNGVFSALGDSKTPFYFLLCSSVANVLMDVYFVAPQGLHMGVVGVAWATFICQGISCLLALFVMLRRIRSLPASEAGPLFSFSMLRRVSVVAVPSILQKSFISVGNVIIQSVINGFGADVIAGYAAAIKLNNLVGTSLFALGDGISNFTAQNLGAGRYDRIKKGFRAGIGLSLVLIVPLSLLYFFAARPLSLLFIDPSATQAIRTSVDLLRILTPFYFCYFKAATDGVLRGSGQMKAFMTGTFTDLLIRVILAVFLSKTSLGARGIWWSWPLGWLIALAISYLFYRHTKWETVRTL